MQNILNSFSGFHIMSKVSSVTSLAASLFNNFGRALSSALLLAALTILGTSEAWAIDAPNSTDAHLTLTQGGHTVEVYSYVENGNEYTLFITSTEDMNGLGGSFWNVNGAGTDMRNSLTVSADKKTLKVTATSTSAPNIYTPLYVMMPGEINFGDVTLNWIAPNSGGGSVTPDPEPEPVAPSYTASSGNAKEGADGNTGSRWESSQTDDEWWQADYGTPQSFTGVEINWETAYAKDFNLFGSNDGTNWTTLKEVRGQNTAGVHKYIFTEEVSYRYVKFEGIKRATGYGYSFWEFSLTHDDPAHFQSLTFTAAKQTLKVGETTTTSYAATDQYGNAWPISSVSYSVAPETIGSINNEGVFTAVAIGTATITITADGHTATTDITVTAPDPVYTASSGNANEAVDNNMGTRWGSDMNDNQWWQADYGVAQEFNAIEIVWEGAYGKDFELLGSNDGTNWTIIKAVEGQTLTSFPATKLYVTRETNSYRYVKFQGIHRGTEWGYSFWEFRLKTVAEPVLEFKVTADKVRVPMRQKVALRSSFMDQYDQSYDIPLTDFTYSVEPANVGSVDENGIFTGTAMGTATVTVTAREAASAPTSSAHRAPGDTFTGHITIEVIDPEPQAGADQSFDIGTKWTPSGDYLKYADYNFVHTDGAHYWMPTYGDFEGTYYYAPTKETRPYIDNTYLYYGQPDMSASQTNLPDPRISETAPGNYYIEYDANGENPTIVAGNRRQRTHWMDHTIWAKPGEEIFLYPFSDFSTTTAYLENYIRWYDYATDKAADGLHFTKPYYYSDNFGVISGTGWMDGRTRDQIATVAHYVAPDFGNINERKYIACDLGQWSKKSLAGAPADYGTEYWQKNEVVSVNYTTDSWPVGIVDFSHSGNTMTYHFAESAGDFTQGHTIAPEKVIFKHGLSYRVSYTYSADKDLDHLIMKFDKTGSDGNTQFLVNDITGGISAGTSYSYTMTADFTDTWDADEEWVFTVMPKREDGTPVTITISDFKIEEMAEDLFTDATLSEWHQAGSMNRNGKDMTFSTTAKRGGNVWEATTYLRLENKDIVAGEHYRLDGRVVADAALDGINVVLKQEGSGGIVYGSFDITSAKHVGNQYIYNFSCDIPSASAPTNGPQFGIGAIGEGQVTLDISELHLVNLPSITDPYNPKFYETWRPKKEAFIAYSYYSKDKGEYTHTVNGGVHTVHATIDDSDRWNNFFALAPKDMHLLRNSKYILSVTAESDIDLSNVSFKMQKIGDGGVFCFDKAGNTLSAGTPKTFEIEFTSLGEDANLELVFSAVSTAAGSHDAVIKLSNITVTASATTGHIDETAKQIFEPIIHGRQLFTIRPAAYIADQLSNNNAEYIKANRRKISARAGVRFNVRLDYEMPIQPSTKSPLYYYMNEDDVANIYGYKIHTYRKENNVLSAEIPGMFVGDAGQYYDAKYEGVMTGLDGKKYYRGIKCMPENAQVGVYVVKIIGCDSTGAELIDADGNPLEIMEYEVTFLDAKDASFLTEFDEASLAASNPATYGHHTENYLKTRASNEGDYSEAAAVTFDAYDNTQFRAHMFPADYPGTYYKWPVLWKGCTYMFGYDVQRRDPNGGYDGNDFNMYMLTKHSSTFACNTAANAYTDSRQNDSSPMGKYGLYDRTFYSTNGATMGNFFAVNASSDPGRMVDAQIDDLCLGSTLFVSAWVAELSNKNQWGGPGDFEPCSETANIIFTFNAVDSRGNKTPLHSFTTGYVDRGNGYSSYMNALHGTTEQVNGVAHPIGSITDGDWNNGITQGTGQQGQWMHVYYSFVPDVSNLTNEQIQNIAYYELSLENNCISSDGADYAIDDVRVFISKPQVIAEQLKPVCSGEKDTEVKVSSNFDSMLSSLGVTEALTAGDDREVYFYYTFLDYDKYYGAGHPTDIQQRFDQAVLKYKYLTTNPDGTPNASTDQGFGIAKFHTYFPLNEKYDEANPEPASGGVNTWSETDKYSTRYIVFNTHPTDAMLYPGKQYIMSIYAPGFGTLHGAGDPPFLNAYNFPIDDKCAKRCIFRVHSSGVVKVNGKVVSDEDEILVCDNQYPIVQIDAYGFDSETNKVLNQPIENQAPFDWYGGSMPEYTAEKSDPAIYNGTEILLSAAIAAFRKEYPVNNFSEDKTNYGDPTLPAKGTYTADVRQYLIDMTTATADKAAKVALFQRSFTMTPGKLTDPSGRQACYLVAIPIEPEVYIIDGETKTGILICTDPSEIRVYIDAHSPHLLHGFAKDINYPEDMDDVPLRVGLDQLDLRTRASLNELKSVTDSYAESEAVAFDDVQTIPGGLMLNVPIRKITPTQSTLTTLRRYRKGDEGFLPEDVLVYLSETNDPEYARLPLSTEPIVDYRYDEGTDEGGNPYKHEVDDEFYLPQVGVLLGLKAVNGGTENMMRLAFRDDFRFKEGYYYRLLIKYTEEYPADYVGEKTECDGQLVFTLKVVPKYQMWVGGTSLDFNNDRNWRRVTSAELNRDYNITGDGRPTSLEADNKVTDGANNNTYSYVPMDFTDVLIPNTLKYPRMYDVDTNSTRVPVLEGGEDFDGNAIDGYLWPNGSNESTTHAMGSGATSLIEYDMAAWSSDKGVNCRPWYANRVEHITFLPGAEMYAQQYLNYQRAWVELELDPDRWYTLTSPLKKTVSGDMYLPSNKTATPGRQMTEHFLPITYDNSRNDRFRPAVYQRAWDHDDIAKIYRMDNDGMVDGNSRLDDAYVAGTWSHVYNDNEEIFTDGRGFSIRTDVSRINTNKPAKVLFRLPKDDTSYTYHNSVEPGTQGSVDATDATTGGHVEGDGAIIDRKLSPNDQTSDFAPGIPNQARLNDVNGSIIVSTAKAGQYFLIGNPFMASLDMEKFFTKNGGIINNKYWIVTADRQEVTVMDGAETVSTGGGIGLTDGPTVAPMQAFFVEAKDADVNSLELKYEEDMQVDFPVYSYNVDGSQIPGNVSPNNPRPGDISNDPRPGLKAPASRSGVARDGQLRIVLSDDERLVSTAVVALKPSASADYEAKEDAILLLDSNLDAQSAIYTVAGETAVSINSLDRIDTVPLGIICANEEAAPKMVTLTFDGADAFPQPLYLYDAQSGETTPITDDLAVNVPANSAGQYFITTGIDNVDATDEANGPAYDLRGIRAVRTNGEQIVIRSGRKSFVK